jgi:hypothetical protein
MRTYNRRHNLAQGAATLSTTIKKNETSTRFILGLLAFGLVGCAISWPSSTTAGGGLSDKTREMVREVSKIAGLTPLCETVGNQLAEMAVKRKVTIFRPTVGYWEKKEEEAAAVWEAARCPMRALVPISAGSSEIALTYLSGLARRDIDS